MLGSYSSAEGASRLLPNRADLGEEARIPSRIKSASMANAAGGTAGVSESF